MLLATLGNLLLAAQVTVPPVTVPARPVATSTPPLTGLSFFESDPQALLKAAAAASNGRTTDVVVLAEDGLYTFDDAGRCTWRYRLTYQVLTQTGVNEWKSLSASWSPWRQERPLLRARVVRQDGTVDLLDPGTVGDVPVEGSDELLSDERRLLAPLPGLALGAVVEQETIVRDTAPLFNGGDTYTFYFGKGQETPVLATRLAIDAPEGLPLQIVQRLLPLTPVRRRVDGRVHILFESGLPEPADVPADAPPDVPRWPRISFSTGRSWQDVAQRYHAIVERQLAGADLRALAEPALAGATGALEKAQRLLSLVQREVRYTGIEFGVAAIEPQTPAETLRRRYGDCKDQATLLVALLREAGLPARVALLRAGSTPEVEPDLPGVGLFNHAIVVLPGPTPLWADPTSPLSRFGQLPAADQGRRALVADPGTQALVLAPTARAVDNRTIETREFHLAPKGPARIVETTELFGAQRARCAAATGLEPAKLRDRLQDYVRAEYAAKTVTRCEWSDPADPYAPMRLVIETPDAVRGTTAGADAVVALLPATFVRDLPALFRSPAATRRPRRRTLTRHGSSISSSPTPTSTSGATASRRPRASSSTDCPSRTR